MRYKIKENKDQMSFSFRKNSWKQNSVLLLFLLMVLGFSARATFRVYLNYKNSQTAANNEKAKLDTLEAREKFLQAELQSLETEKGRERKLREKFGVGLPGENLAIIVESDPSNLSTSTTSLWSQLKNFFGNLFK